MLCGVHLFSYGYFHGLRAGTSQGANSFCMRLLIDPIWSYSDAYDGSVNLLNSSLYFDYKNYSVPKDDPIHNARYYYQLKEAIRNQMQHASCVLILAGIYSTYSKWINIEIELAQEMGKRL